PAAQGEWFGELERVALAGRRDGVTIVDLERWLNSIRMAGQDAMDAAFRLLHRLLLLCFPSYSLWWSTGSEWICQRS
ncbi:MAG TPA: hypothetical protein VFX11_06290, partial [Candidatus Kapabacteria bacterium]|nr:hypothetical protein [Candidatus Kapabacteria bacterium]